MAGILAKTLREKTSGELQDQLILEKKKLFDGVVKSSSGESIKAHDKRAGKRLIARIETILSERIKRKELDAADCKDVDAEGCESRPDVRARDQVRWTNAPQRSRRSWRRTKRRARSSRSSREFERAISSRKI